MGPGGAAHDRAKAIATMIEALRETPGQVRGEVWRVEVSIVGDASYEYRSLIASAWRDTATGRIQWAIPTGSSNVRTIPDDRNDGDYARRSEARP